MANKIPAFLTGGRCQIVMNMAGRDEIVAFAQNISISDDMSVQPVGGLGSMNNMALEPTSYMARGSMTITQYSGKIFKVLNSATKIITGTNQNGTPEDISDDTFTTVDGPIAPSAITADAVLATKTADGTTQGDGGNTMLRQNFFSPVHLLMSRTFNLRIFENTPTYTDNKVTKTLGTKMAELVDVRLTNYSISFSPGQLVNETVSFIATKMIDN